MAGYRSWSDQDRLTETDVNTYLMGQSVPRFPAAGERDAQMGGVVPGQLSYLIDVDRFERVDADGDWVPLIPEPPTAPTVPAIRCGTAVLTAGTATATDPVLTDATVIMLTTRVVSGVPAPSALAVGVRSVSDHTFTIVASQSADTSVVNWLAIEPV